MNVDIECREECLKRQQHVTSTAIILIYQLYITDTIFVDTLHL